MLKNGFNPKIYKVQENLTGEEANKLEKELILRFGRRDLGTGILLNLSDGGQGVLNMSEKHKNAISKRHKGKIIPLETRQKMGPKKGTQKSEEHKKKLSNSLIGKHHSKQTIEKSKNLRWVNNRQKSILIHKDELDGYLKQGWIHGRHKYFSLDTLKKMSISAKNRKPMSLETRKIIGSISKDKRWINNSIENRFINFSEVDSYLLQGWGKGKKKSYENRK